MSRRNKSRQPGGLAQRASAAQAAPRFPLAGLPPDTYRILVAWALLGGAIGAIYGRAVHAPFIFDDLSTIVDNPSITRLWPLTGDSGVLNPPLTAATTGRQLVNLSLALNYYFGQLDPFGYHVFNILVHLGSALLLWAIVRRTLRLEYFGGRFERAAEPLALLVALVWALHPLQTECVVYVTQRTESMMALFYLATLYGSLRYWAATTPAGRSVWLALATLACMSGMACKEVMVSAPVVVLLFERTFIARSWLEALRKSWPLYAGLAVGWVLFGILNFDQPRSINAGFNRGLPAHVWWFSQAHVLWMYLKLVVWPWPLIIHYEMPYLDTFAAAWPWILAVALLWIATLVLLWQRSSLGFLGIWVFAILSPTLVVPLPTEVAAERRMYLPLAAPAVLAIIGGYQLARSIARFVEPDASRAASGWHPLAMTTACAVIVAMVLGVLDVRRLEAYHDDLAVWRDLLVYQPENAKAHFNLGVALMNVGRSPEAIEHYQRVLKSNSSFAMEAHFNLGAVLTHVGRPQEAIEHFQQVLKFDPDFAKAHNNLGLALMQCGRSPEAIERYEQAIRLDPDFARAHSNLGIALANEGRAEDAIAHFEQALRSQPDLLDAYLNLTVQYSKTRRSADAIATAEKALQLARSQGQTAKAKQIEAWLASYRKDGTLP